MRSRRPWRGRQGCPRIRAALAPFESVGVRFHALRTRQAGRRGFASVHILVPGAWTVQHGHDVAEEVEAAIQKELPYVTLFTHVEPAEDPRSLDDQDLE